MGELEQKMYSETPVGAGYYALRENTSKCGKKYTKLVKANRSPEPAYGVLNTPPKLTPSVGHNQRRQKILDKRKTNGN